MKLWILVISMAHGDITYGYKFLERVNCERIGKSIVGNSKQMNYTCKLKYFKVKKYD
jgi:hypothetical protein